MRTLRGHVIVSASSGCPYLAGSSEKKNKTKHDGHMFTCFIVVETKADILTI